MNVKVLTEITYAARKWNPGEVIDMPENRAKKFIDNKQVEAIESAPEAKKGGSK